MTVSTETKTQRAARWVEKLLADANKAGAAGRMDEADQCLTFADRVAAANGVAWEDRQ